MMKKAFKILFYIIIIVLFCENINVQRLYGKSISKTDSLFLIAQAYYSDENYAETLNILKNPLFRDADSEMKEIVLFLQGQTLFEMGNYTGSLLALKKIINYSTSGKFIHECHYLIGHCYYKMELPAQALREYLVIFNDKSSPSFLSKKAAMNAVNMYVNELTLQDLKSIKIEFDNPDIKKILDLKISYKYIKSGNISEAGSLVKKILKSSRGKIYYKQAVRLNNYIDMLKKQDVVIGFIIPREGENKELGNQIYEGAELARVEFNEESPRKVSIVVEDSKNNPIEGVMAFRRLMNYNSILGVIGPLNKDVCASVSVESDYQKIPVIFPYTSDSKFSKLGEYVFQINADDTVHIKLALDYAYGELDLKTFAILTPVNESGRNISEYFMRYVEKIGGTLVSEQAYFSGTDNLGVQFKQIRNQGFNMMFMDSLRILSDSLDISILDSEQIDIDTLRHRFFTRKKTELEETALPGTDIDTLDIPITSIDCLFLSVEKEDRQIVLTQFPYYNIQTQVIGGRNWYNPEIVEDNINYIRGMVFTSDYFIGESNRAYIEFVNKFRVKYGKSPGLAAVYGYDCMKLFLHAIKQDAFTREEAKRALLDIQTYSGLKGNITFDKNSRMNKYISILKHSRNKIVEVR
ncbi:ABC transporter substrate-binding protein [candidate division KSB1 bacterium]